MDDEKTDILTRNTYVINIVHKDIVLNHIKDIKIPVLDCSIQKALHVVQTIVNEPITPVSIDEIKMYHILINDVVQSIRKYLNKNKPTNVEHVLELAKHFASKVNLRDIYPDKEDNVCPVCYENTDSTLNLRCSHILCESCHKEWYDHCGGYYGCLTCPICRDTDPNPLHSY